VLARAQNEHMLATIRQLYDNVRAEQDEYAVRKLLPTRGNAEQTEQV
jgi:hypothetical protein